MAAPRRPATKQEIADSFEVLTTEDQAEVLDALVAIHRILKRERSRTTAHSASDDATMRPTPTEWLTSPDLALQQRIAGDTTPQEHEN